MKTLIVPAWMLGVAISGVPALAQQNQQPCPAGQATSSGGGCVQDMPATQHQQEVLKKPATGSEQPAATGAATGTTTGAPQGGDMPATPHQQEVLKKPAG